MRVKLARFAHSLREFAVLWAAAAAIVLALLSTFALGPSAQALPSYARQTGQPCGTCHTDFPGLTPYGRRFKIGGYTYGGGKYRSTLFPSSEDHDKDGKEKTWAPPISMMAIVGFTHTQADLTPPTAAFAVNDNTVLSPASFFWGGAITDHIGAFAQVTYNAPPPGGFTDPFGHTWTWDNTDIRFADSTAIGNIPVTYGITANNNPTVQDPWNTTPAWAFPYVASTIANTPAAGTIINGAFAAHVGSVGAYAYINDVLYVEATAYRTLDPNTQNALGTDPFGAPGLFDVAPYWRVAFEPHIGRHWLEVGTFGMMTAVHPWTNAGTTDTSTLPMTDKFTDFGFDTQYQYQGDNFWLTLRGTYIHEFQKLDASFATLAAANPTNILNEARAYASLAYGNDNRIVLTGQYFNIWGTSDTGLYGTLASGFSPDSEGWVAEVAYIPFISTRSPGWPWFNARIGLQYTWYNKFDGTSVGASNNNSLFLYAWFAM